MIKGSVHQKDITVINIYVLNIGPLKYIKQMLTVLKREIENSIIMDFTHLSLIDCKTRLKN